MNVASWETVGITDLLYWIFILYIKLLFRHTVDEPTAYFLTECIKANKLKYIYKIHYNNLIGKKLFFDSSFYENKDVIIL